MIKGKMGREGYKILWGFPFFVGCKTWSSNRESEEVSPKWSVGVGLTKDGFMSEGYVISMTETEFH